MLATPTWIIAGGAGFLGVRLCEQALEAGARVVCVDDFSTSSPDAVAHLAEEPDFELVEADVAEPLDLTGPVSVVAHLASPASPPAYLAQPLHTLQAGSAGTINLLDLAADKGARFLLASTSEVYGDPQVHPQTEDYRGNVDPTGPRSVYDEAKRFAETVASSYRRSSGVDAGIVRIFNTFGPRMDLDDGRVVPTFVRQALCDEPMTIAGDGSQTRSLCYVDDTVEALWRMGNSEHPGPINVGGTDEVTILQLAEQIRTLAGSCSELHFIELPQDDPKVRRPDTARAEEVLGWAPKIDVEDGLRRTIDWARSVLRSDSVA